MKYAVLLTKQPNGGIRASIPALPECAVDADNRDEAIRLACQAIAQIASRSEVVQVEVPQQPRITATSNEVPWEWFGSATDDPTWDALFDDIEQRRDATRKGR